MRCCTIKLKRSWEYCPGCGESIEWPRKLPFPEQWAESEIGRLVAKHGVAMTVNILESRKMEILAGRYNA